MEPSNIDQNNQGSETTKSSQETVSQEKKHKFLRPLLIVLVTVVIIGCASFGFFLWQVNKIAGTSYQSLKKTSSENTNEPQGQMDSVAQTTSPTSATKSQSSSGQSSASQSTSMGISGWKTYTHTNPSFSFQYPTDSDDVRLLASYITDGPLKTSDFIISFYKTDETDINKVAGISSSDKIKQVTVGHSIQAIGPLDIRNDLFTHVYYTKYAFIKNGYFYNIALSTVNSGSAIPETWQKILSTLSVD